MAPVVEQAPYAAKDGVHPFDRSGVARVSDLVTREWREDYERLEREQSAFLAHEHAFRSDQYPWPRDPLHTWSRVWEYPYAYHHLTRRVDSRGPGPRRIVDFGSGVTFFPFALAKNGYRVTCMDVDPVVAGDLDKAIRTVPHSPGSVDFVQCEERRLPLGDEQVDAVYSVSVLEHIPNPHVIVPEIARILVPGGLFVLTIDLDLRGDAAIGSDAYKTLVSVLEKSFRYVYRVTTTHPADMLDNTNSRFPTPGLDGLGAHWYELKQSIKPFLGRTKSSALPYHLAVEGFVLERAAP